jgi:transposase
LALSGCGEGGGIFTVDLYRKVRLACRDGVSERAAARQFGISRESVKKMLSFSVPPGYRRSAPVRRPKLDGFTEIIEQWLRDDLGQHRKQRHTAKRVFERLRDEHGFVGGYTIVKDYVREHRRRGREMFVPLQHPPGHAQADFGEASVVIDGVEQTAHFFAFDLPHSDACFVRAYPAATAEAWVDGHVHAFAFFGGVPQSVLYDNDRCLVARILPDGTRRRATLFSGFLSHYLIRDRYGRPGKGNDKGAVEGLVGWARRTFMVPLPRFASWEDFNAWLEAQCCKRQAEILRGHAETIGARLTRDLEAMADLPAAPFEACDQATGRVSSQALVRYKTNDYSVPVAYGHRDVWVRGYVDQVVIGCGGEIVARHPRCYDREDMVFDPVHYLPLLEKKIGALDQAAPLAEWDLPPEFATLRRLMEARMIKAGRREYVQVLRLLETFDLDDLHAAVKTALRIGAVGFDAVKHLVLCRVEKRPPKLDLDIYPYLPRANVARTSAASYMCLVAGDAA